MNSFEAVILLVEDDVNDQIFIRRAFKVSGGAPRITIVNDGEEAMAYLNGVGAYRDRVRYPLPGLIMTDMKMPRMGGIDFLKWIHQQKRVPFDARGGAHVIEQPKRRRECVRARRERAYDQARPVRGIGESDPGNRRLLAPVLRASSSLCDLGRLSKEGERSAVFVD